MPSMMRPQGKPKKIAYALLGTPPAFQGKRNIRVGTILLAQNTWRIR